jgi:alpha-tubulin suppressor-like RCC1 family protein
VWAWGSNGSGQLGDGTTDNSSTIVQVIGEAGEGVLTGVSLISAGVSHSVALKSDGTVWAWGANYNGQLGNDTKVSSTTPIEIMSLAVDDNSGLSTTVIIAIAAAAVLVIILAAWLLLKKK